MENITTENMCARCKKVSTITSENIITERVKDEKGKDYRLLYYVCEGCGENTPLQVDDNETLSILNDLKKVIIRVAKRNLKGETIDQKDRDKKDRIMKRLEAKRNVLKSGLNGKKIFDLEGKIISNCLTFNNAGDIL